VYTLDFADSVAGGCVKEGAEVEALDWGVEASSRARLACARVKELADIFGRLWRGTFGRSRSGGFNKGAIGLGAEGGAGAGA
jgi:hypothetical protein